MVLPRGLKRGYWMELDNNDIQALSQAAGEEPAERFEERDDRAERSPGVKVRRRGKFVNLRRNAGEGDPRTDLSFGEGQEDAPYDPLDDQPPANADHMGRKGASQRQRGTARLRDDNDGGSDPIPKNVDPMKTSFGYIGADSFNKQRNNNNRNRGPRGRR